VRLAKVHAACDVLGIRRGFDENDRTLPANPTFFLPEECGQLLS
jgi:hypothetical protein